MKNFKNTIHNPVTAQQIAHMTSLLTDTGGLLGPEEAGLPGRIGTTWNNVTNTTLHLKPKKSGPSQGRKWRRLLAQQASPHRGGMPLIVELTAV